MNPWEQDQQRRTATRYITVPWPDQEERDKLIGEWTML